MSQLLLSLALILTAAFGHAKATKVSSSADLATLVSMNQDYNGMVYQGGERFACLKMRFNVDPYTGKVAYNHKSWYIAKQFPNVTDCEYSSNQKVGSVHSICSKSGWDESRQIESFSEKRGYRVIDIESKKITTSCRRDKAGNFTPVATIKSITQDGNQLAFKMNISGTVYDYIVPL